MINFVKKIIDFDFFLKKNLACGGHPLGKILKRRAGLRQPTASGLDCDRKIHMNFGFVYQVSIGFRGESDITPYVFDLFSIQCDQKNE